MTTTKSPTTFKVGTNHTIAVADSSAANSTAFLRVGSVTGTARVTELTQ